MLAAYTDDAVISSLFHESGRHEDGDFRRYSGREEIERYFAGTDQFQQLKFTDLVFRPTADGVSVYVEGKGDCIMADGTPYRNGYVFRFDVNEEGKTFRMDEWVNPVTAAPAFKRGTFTFTPYSSM
jgi:ketosteroid isomerase-like protein